MQSGGSLGGDAADKEREYEFPGDSENTTEKHKIFSPKMKKDALKALCRRYGLGVSGTVPTLQEKLKGFSGDRDQWTLLKAGARRTHKGLQQTVGGKKKILKGAQLRREEWLGHIDVPQSCGTSTGSHIRKGQTVAWAKEFQKRHPTRPHSPKLIMEDTTKPNVHPMFGGQYVVDTLDEILNRLPTQASSTTTTTTTATSTDTFEEATGLVAAQSCSLPTSDSYTGLRPQQGYVPSTVPFQSFSTGPAPTPNLYPPSRGQPPQPPLSSSTCSPQALEVVEPEQDHAFANEVRTLNLLKGPALQFTLSEVVAQDPNSKAISFAHNIDKLGCTWSDTYEHFDGKLCDIKIHGRGIPIKYWGKIFKIHTPL
ncbi:hypothetical protein E1B28_013128 [Marasmius oreades]|uniref:SAP domain-containing protein n=1 Tax=Marasmius oreades TaxID=181124 RepID=A0A9P7RQC7_9AGAR|nr:uncharacterized protein E1B28_013128 [Marasmius oreades]KAG7087148.1 hypothetical protein E1B28_013128 [Marasmius oreades]